MTWAIIWDALKIAVRWLARGSKKWPLLIVDDNSDDAHLLGYHLERLGRRCEIVLTVDEALGRLRSGRYEAAFVDLNMPYNGQRLIERIQDEFPHINTIGVTGSTEILSQMKSGDYLDALFIKTVDQTAIKEMLNKAGL